MNGVMSAPVSAGSSPRETSVTCTPMAMVPSGGAASAGDRPAQIRAKVKAAATSRDEPRISIPPLETFGNAVFVLEKLPHLWQGEAQGNVCYEHTAGAEACLDARERNQYCGGASMLGGSASTPLHPTRRVRSRGERGWPAPARPTGPISLRRCISGTDRGTEMSHPRRGSRSWRLRVAE